MEMESELKKQVLLEDLTDDEIKRISKIIQKLDFDKNDYLFKEKDDTKGLYLIHRGKVEIAKVTPDGWKQTLAVLTNGSFFGELSILEKRLHEAFAIATEPTEIFLIEKEGFERMEKEDPVIAFKIIKKIAHVMCKNIRRMNERFLNALISY